MKRAFLFFLTLGLVSMLNAQTLKPYILGTSITGTIDEIKQKVKDNLESANFKVAGEYMPAEDASRYVIVVTHPALDKAVKKNGGLTGFAATLRAAITNENGKLNITYTNPEYWGNAYFRKDYPSVEAEYKEIAAAFKKAMEGVGTYSGKPFGSKKGLKIDNLRKYHYMFGMPYFDDVVELGDFDSHADAVASIDKALKEGKPGVSLVYKYTVPGTELTLYGIALSGEKGESSFLPKIDLDTPKHTAFLPYEMLVNGDEVVMLHGRFRIAIAFPDLAMGTFTKIMSTPGDIETLLQQLVED
jgi:uncharacterized protein (DUF302 family)